MLLYRVLHLLVLFLANAMDFVEQPRNLTITVEESVLIPCILQQTSLQPNWIINGMQYTINNLPSGLTALSSGLLIDGSVSLMYNQSSFQCYIVKYIGPPPPLYKTIVSTTGYLAVSGES